MKLRRNPPMPVLEAFEAAARELSFQKAAQQLHLTPSAVSHQIKALEEYLGFPVFRRLTRALELTDGGRAYLESVQRSLETLRQGSREVQQRYAERTSLKISAAPFLTTEFIAPALPSFQAEHPEIELHIETSLRLADLHAEDVDIALRFADRQAPPEIHCEQLMKLTAVPICSAGMNQALATAGPEAIHQATLIHSSSMPQGWQQWAQLAGFPLAVPKKDLWLDGYLAILRATEQGVGLTVGLLPLIEPWLREGRLAIPWPQLQVEIPQGFCLLCRSADVERRDIRAFRDWLLEQLNSGG